MPSTLRFRSPYRDRTDSTSYPRTPKSPSEVYAGAPATPVDGPSTKRLSLKIVFGIVALAAFLSLGLFKFRHHLIPDIPVRSTVYWRARSAFSADADGGLP